jgi:uncharacterized spore protein YtfJ
MDFTTATDELVREVSGIPKELGASACFGEPVERDGHMLIPVARVNFGYGLGFGGGAAETYSPSNNGEGEQTKSDGGGGGGGGGGGSSSPVAVIDISDKGVEIQPIEDKTRISMAGITMIAWNMFWVLWTVRTFIHARAKTRKLELEKSL